MSAMASTSYASSSHASSSMAPKNMMVTVWYACHHFEMREAPQNDDISTTQVVAKACSNALCQAASLDQLLSPRARVSAESKALIRKMDSQLTLAGMNAEAALRTFSLVEPMLPEEIAAANISPSIVQALTHSGPLQRYRTAGTFLGHRRALAMLEEVKSCFRIGAPIWATGMVANELTAMSDLVQHRLMALQAAVYRLTAYAYPAPAAWFHMADGVGSFQKDWGVHQLAFLRQSNEGFAILSKPLTNDNILAAKACVKTTQENFEAYLDSERASFSNDYPGIEELYASGLMKSSQAMLAEQFADDYDDDSDTDMNDDDASSDAFSLISIEPQNAVQCPGPDIRALRPQFRVLSRSMARTTLRVNSSGQLFTEPKACLPHFSA